MAGMRRNSRYLCRSGAGLVDVGDLEEMWSRHMRPCRSQNSFPPTRNECLHGQPRRFPEVLVERASEEDLGVLTRDICFGKRALGLVPLVDPVDHAEQGESSGARADPGFGSASALHIADQVFHKVNVVLLCPLMRLRRVGGRG